MQFYTIVIFYNLILCSSFNVCAMDVSLQRVSKGWRENSAIYNETLQIKCYFHARKVIFKR